MEAYYHELLKQLDGYTVQGLFDGSREIKDIVTLQHGTKGRVFFFDQEPMFEKIDRGLWNHIFQEPTIFANSELNSSDKEYLRANYPNFIDWYYFSNALVSREWFNAQRYNYAGWSDQKQLLLDCNLITGSRQYRVYLIYLMFKHGYNKNSFVSFNGSYDWFQDLKNNDQFNILDDTSYVIKKIPLEKISYDNWNQDHKLNNGLMQSRIPLEYYSQVNYILVSETLCVENKKHLTEKVFKPIAAGKPFILTAGYKNLEYLKSYGFETFNSLWNENYDNILNPKDRIDQIFNLIDQITLDNISLCDKNSLEYKQKIEIINQKLDMYNQAHVIAQRNRNYFWSDEFYNLVIKEALDNLNTAKDELKSKQI
jgi:hypothetical protein